MGSEGAIDSHIPCGEYFDDLSAAASERIAQREASCFSTQIICQGRVLFAFNVIDSFSFSFREYNIPSELKRPRPSESNKDISFLDKKLNTT